ncbi:MAG TPA: M28 family peptidase [Candidatus Thermoplasmatota archaeon]|nr:M28 family peptidase [Candidatus Thermoplasmatota archaeon]
MQRSLALLLVAAAIAGCLSDDAGTPEPKEGQTLVQRVTADQPPIEWDVKEQVDWWEDVATSYPKHDSNLPTNAQLRQRLVADLQALGLDVEVRSYPGQVQNADVPAVPGSEIYAIIGTKQGTTMPDHRVGLVAHYDTQTATVMGAYDDASGVASQYSICKALVAVPMQRTLACIFFDAEERGLVASERYVQDVVTEGDEPYSYDLVFGYDMTGLNWPGYPTWKMYVMPGPEDDVPVLQPFAQDILHDMLGYPTDGVEVLDVHDRNSDEMNFKRAGIPILRFAGGRNANDYDQYHKPLDTVDHVYGLAGGRANFEAGFATIVEASYTTMLAFDGTSMDELRATYG